VEETIMAVDDGVAVGTEGAVAEAEGEGFGVGVGVEVGAAVGVKVAVGIGVVGDVASGVLSARAGEAVAVTWLVLLTRAAVGEIEGLDMS
jgi:hypothetical protein